MQRDPDPALQPRAALAFTVGPLLYWWPRQALMDFYAQVADSAAQTVVLGEVICSRRNELSLDDWLALARDLSAAGKEVVLATQALLASEAELRTLRRITAQGDYAVEAGDASALRLLARAAAEEPGRKPFVIGPHINVYNRAALVEHAALGAGTWVAPVELALAAVAAINPASNRVPGPAGAIATEVFAFGRVPLSFSARCFTARHHRLPRDGCDFRCRDDADGLPLASSEGQPFLVINGTQLQSAGVQALLGEAAALREAGVSRLRMSPTSSGFFEALRLFDAVINHGADAKAAAAELRQAMPSAVLVDGYARRQPGMALLEA